MSVGQAGHSDHQRAKQINRTKREASYLGILSPCSRPQDTERNEMEKIGEKIGVAGFNTKFLRADRRLFCCCFMKEPNVVRHPPPFVH